MLNEIGRALDAVEQDQNVRALIVTGRGSAFSSGFDLKEQMERAPAGLDEWRPMHEPVLPSLCSGGLSCAV